MIRHLLSALLLCPLPLAAAFAEDASTRPSNIRIVLAGDSTVTDKSGWGVGFKNYFGTNTEVINLSQGGRSSKSFIAEGHWAKCLEQKPDYILIQFGHNDQPGKGPERETDPQTTYRQNMTRYVDEARAAGSKPILVTSISRRKWKDDGHIHSDLQDYVDVVKQIAAEKQVPLIELHTRSIEVYESLGKEGCELIEPVSADGKFDSTHLNAAGSELFGQIVADELRRALPELQKYRKPYSPPTSQAVSSTHPSEAASATVAAAMAASSGKPTSKGARTINVPDDFKTIQEAIAAVPDDNSDRTIIHIKPGVYFGQIVLPAAKANVTFAGERADETILTYALNVIDPIPPTVPPRLNGNGVVILADGFRAENITFRNTSGDHGQAMALRIQGDRAVLRNCRLLGWQDTLLLNSRRQYFRDCYVEGRVDFIYGSATAVFDNCEIHSKNGGYVTAASTPEDHPFGFVFLNCRLTSSGDVPTYLGRPWRPFGSVTYLNCEMGGHIRPEGWNNWGKVENEKTARYAEYNTTGAGANSDKRIAWSKQLTSEQAGQITVEAVLAGEDGWKPQ